MNRIQDLVADLVPARVLTGDLDQAIDMAGFGATTAPAPHAAFTPLHYEPSYAYPLVVWLHGASDDEQQLKRVMPMISMQNFVAVAPRGTLSERTKSGKRGFRWSQSPDHIWPAQQAVFESIEAMEQRFRIAESRIFLAGYDDGGTMALRIGLNNPQRFAGVISLSGPWPSDHCPLRNLHAVRDLPVMLAVGRDARRFCETQVCHDLRLMHAAGMSVDLRQYPCGDELTTQMLTDMNRWMMERVCPSGVSSSSSD